MTRDRGPRRPRRRDRSIRALLGLTALSLTASGCVVVHGEREVVPTVTRAEAARALAQFTSSYNKADKAYDSSLDRAVVTGAVGDIDGGRLRAGHVTDPGGNPAYTPLELTDARFTIPKKAGWPRWFVADAAGNKGGTARWVLVFVRDGLDERWQVAFLTLVAPGDLPAIRTDKDGLAEAVPATTAQLAVRPADLSDDYVGYLKDGRGSFAPGPRTSAWRELRQKSASRPGLATQYIDEPLTRGDYAPLALRTADGGALVFFATHHYEKQTAAQGTTVPAPSANVRALTTGEIKQSLTLEFVSNQVALDPAKGAAGQGVNVLGRVQGLTGGKGE
ncbi:hypothetical protein ACIQU5_03650 [Streptomyces sp. NPDC090306]|uniref:hypothetical protein n=1 Tax=unclassified Streptomyces TaxID=2593676 RepID=UPI0036EDFA7D